MSKNDDSFRQEEEEVTAGESELLHDLGKGAIAGLIATIPVAVIALIKQAIGLAPGIDIIGILGRLVGQTSAIAGWVVLFVGGTLMGIAFASLDAHVENVTEAGEMARGAILGFLLWIVLMLLCIPLYGNQGFGVMFAGLMLVSILIYGVVMGLVYEKMKPEHVSEA
jgi:Na+-translocating ferredoxin:NAD+ oxidoreductase RnfD subunit